MTTLHARTHAVTPADHSYTRALGPAWTTPESTGHRHRRSLLRISLPSLETGRRITGAYCRRSVPHFWNMSNRETTQSRLILSSVSVIVFMRCNFTENIPSRNAGFYF